MVSRQFKFENGDRVREIITGFTGIITGTVYYLTGCNQYLITAKPKDDTSEPTSIWYDEGRIELIEQNAKSPKSVKANDNGCDILPSTGKRGY